MEPTGSGNKGRPRTEKELAHYKNLAASKRDRPRTEREKAHLARISAPERYARSSAAHFNIPEDEVEEYVRQYRTQASVKDPEFLKEFWQQKITTKLATIWSPEEYDQGQGNPGMAIIIAWRASSAAADPAIQLADADDGQQAIAQRLVHEHNTQQALLHPNQRVRLVAIYSLTRTRATRDGIFEDCGPAAGRPCPVIEEQLLYNTLSHIRDQGNMAVILQRGLDGLTNARSLESFLRF